MTVFGLTNITERFDMLREIGTLFIVKPENLKSIIQDGALSRVEITFLRPYLMMRSDWNKLSRMERDLFREMNVLVTNSSNSEKADSPSTPVLQQE